MQNIYKLFDSGKTVFSIVDLKNILQIPTLAGLNSFLMRAKKGGMLINIRHGLWGLKQYDVDELANKLKKRSYISLETVLTRSGIIFQSYHTLITCVSDNSKTITTDTHTFRYSGISKKVCGKPI